MLIALSPCRWVLFSRNPLSPEQLYFAILSEIEPEALSRWDPDEMPLEAIQRFILDSSKGLAEATKSTAEPKIQFIHESVKDFLLKENGLRSVWFNLESNVQGQGHERLKQCCLNYINMDVSEYLGIRDLHQVRPKAPEMRRRRVRRRISPIVDFPFLEYAVSNVLYHADAAEGDGISQTDFLKRFPLARWLKMDNLFEKEEHKHTAHASLLYVLAERNMSNLIRRHPSNRSCLQMEKEHYGTPLLAAVANRSGEAIRVFLDIHAADLSPESWLHKHCNQYFENQNTETQFGTSFLVAGANRSEESLRGFEDILAADPPLNNWLHIYNNLNFENQHSERKFEIPQGLFEFSDGSNVLPWLARFGEIVPFALALEVGNMEPDTKDKNGRTPLQHAVFRRHNNIVQLLLDTGKVDVNSKDKVERTPLWHAIINGDQLAVELLLGTGNLDVNMKDLENRTPLELAVMEGQMGIAGLLQCCIFQ